MSKILCQRDLNWNLKKIGASNLLIGDYGCTTTALAELNNHFGANCTPLDVAQHKEFYTKDGLVLWPNVQMKFAVPEESPRVYGYSQTRIFDSLTIPGKGVLLEVNIPKADKHWLFAEAIGYNNVIYARDPWNGALVDIVHKYGKITGSAHFKKRI